MERIIVVGPPGSGKSTLGAALGERLGCPHIELDALWWDAGWTEAGEDLFVDRVGAAVAAGRWVVDGNYFSVGGRRAVWPLADTVVWLDLPRAVTVPRVVWRSVSRSLRRTELWNGNRESVREMVGDGSIVRYAWREHGKYGRRYAALDQDQDPSLAHLTWIRLRSPCAVREWLASIPGPGSGGA